MIEAKDVWQKYQNGVDHHNRTNMYEKTKKAYSFFSGDQWYNTSNKEDLPVVNIIRPTVDYKVAVIAQNHVNITYTPMNNDENRHLYQRVCDKLSDYTRMRWENANMDDLCWKAIKAAAITGDSYVYFPDDKERPTLIDNINIYFGDEQQKDLQKQPYIIIYDRRPISFIKAEAKRYGLSEKQIKDIKADSDTTHAITEEAQSEVSGEDKCSCLLYMYKDEMGYVHTLRTTKDVIYRPDKVVAAADAQGNITDGLTVYPIASLIWQENHGSARGIGEVTPMIPNQTEINKTYARRAAAVKTMAYPKLVYDRGRIDDISSLDKAGAVIGVDNLQSTPISAIVDYLSPAPISSEADKLSEELIALTRNLAGAGDAILGQINPEKASGTAILAVTDQAQLPLNECISDFRRFVEDVAAIWYALWVLYNPNGVKVTAKTEDMVYDITIPAVLLKAMQVEIKTDVSSSTPFSKYAQQQAIDNLFGVGAITFEEYVSLLDATSVLPKAALEELLNKRKEVV